MDPNRGSKLEKKRKAKIFRIKIKKGAKTCQIVVKQGLKLGYTWCMARKNGNGKRSRRSRLHASESLVHHLTRRRRQNSGQTTTSEENNPKSSNLKLVTNGRGIFIMLNDDLLIEYGQKILSDKAQKGDLVMINGYGDGFFLDPVSKMMIRVQRGSVCSKVQENFDDRGRALLYDYNTGTAFVADEKDYTILEVN